ncbi:hypothetical protein HMI49_16230 [Corallococcus exercitus]|uniref:Uncharacterized protein n=1 Tax=Corallococcus exercitus TaxID=2316736 RepID=A0A7Y4NT87_9BACT|nr:hypothetical protein [Corallococcus exercitus]NOK34747.1 hypothetical protein [Corallococcus exercitus]
MHASHRLSLLGLLVTATPAASDPQSFGGWFDARVKAEKVVVRERFQLDLDGDGREDDVVCYVFETPREWVTTAPVILVGLATGERFALRGQGLGPGFVECPTAPLATAEEQLKTLQVGMSAPTGFRAEASLRFDRKGPLLTRSRTQDQHHLRTVDLVLQDAEFISFESLNATPTDGGDIDSAQESPPVRSAAMLASGTKVPAPPAPVWPSWGQKDWDGFADANLKVQWLRKGDAVTLIATLRDDHPVSAADARVKAIFVADHLELWWREWKAGSSRPVRLGVARTADGKPVAAWFQPPGREDTPLPPVRWTAPDRLEVDLPLSWILTRPLTPAATLPILLEPPSERTDLTVAFSDSDGKGPETLLSTTQSRPDGETFSPLFIAEPECPHPRLSRRVLQWVPVGQGTTLRELVW